MAASPAGSGQVSPCASCTLGWLSSDNSPLTTCRTRNASSVSKVASPVNRPAVDDKGFAGHQPLATARRHGLGEQPTERWRRQRKVDRFQPLVDVQGARASVGSQPIPVKQPVGHIAGSLHLEEHHSGAQRMDCAGGEQQASLPAGARSCPGIWPLRPPPTRVQRSPIDSWPQASEDPGARLRLEDVPGFGLAQFGRVEQDAAPRRDGPARRGAGPHPAA